MPIVAGKYPFHVVLQLSLVTGVPVPPAKLKIKVHLATTYGGQSMNTAKFSNGASICTNDSTAVLVAYEHRIKRNVAVEATAPLLKMLEMKAENTKQTAEANNKHKSIKTQPESNKTKLGNQIQTSKTNIRTKRKF